MTTRAMTPAELTRLLDKLDIKRATAAQLIGVNRRTLHRWEHGLSPIRPVWANTLRQLLKPKAK